ncbi:hypothetical protein AOLI_G00184790 [Acnodon oligacanthus]
MHVFDGHPAKAMTVYITSQLWCPPCSPPSAIITTNVFQKLVARIRRSYLKAPTDRLREVFCAPVAVMQTEFSHSFFSFTDGEKARRPRHASIRLSSAPCEQLNSHTGCARIIAAGSNFQPDFKRTDSLFLLLSQCGRNAATQQGLWCSEQHVRLQNS